MLSHGACVCACVHVCTSCRAMVVCAWGEDGACGLDKGMGNEVHASSHTHTHARTHTHTHAGL